MIRTKIVATVGPACDSEAGLGALIEAGVDVFRLNFSHGTLEGHAAVLQRIRKVAGERGAVVAVMGDLCGPKIRLGTIAGGKCTLVPGSRVVMQRQPVEGTCERLSTIYPQFVDDAKVGDRVLIDDGNVLLRVVEKRADELTAVCEVGGEISDHKGINLPDSAVSSPSLTDKDRRDLEWAVRHEVDYVALSFVRQPEDLRELKAAIRACCPDSSVKVVSKIEKPQALERIDAIIEESDVVLVARGDLGVEMDVSRVPIIQKEIVLASRRCGKPVIVATQMLQSMVNAPVPTRAEVSDVANAILDGADAVMLSAETSVGKYPVQAVQTMNQVAAQTEAFTKRFGHPWSVRATQQAAAPAVIHGASVIAEGVAAKLVVAWTLSGDAPRLLSRHRLAATVVALTPDVFVCRQMAMLYGVVPICLPTKDGPKEMLRGLSGLLLQRGLASEGETVVVVSDMRPDVPGETDAILMHTVGRAS